MNRSRFRPPFPRINRNSPLANGLVFAGLGGGASTLKMVDASGYGNDGTLTNMDPATDWVWVPELGRWALDIDATNNKVLCDTSLLSDPSAFTLATWFMPRSVSGVHFILGRHNAAELGIALVVDGTNLSVPINKWATNDTRYSAGLAVGVWRHAAVTQYGAVQALYLDGNLVSSRTNADIPTIPDATQFSLGEFAAYTGTWPLNGQLADAIVAGAALSPDIIKALADPSNVMLEVGGVPLILPPHRVSFPAAVAEPSGFKPYWLRRSTQIIGGGIAA